MKHLIIAIVLCLVSATKKGYHHGRRLIYGRLSQPPHLPILGQVEMQTFIQKVDHFNDSDERTFAQRYFVSRDHWKGGQTVFLGVGGMETITLDQISHVDPYDWIVNAEHFNALCYLLEHRYYGHSLPTPDASTGNLRWLSSQQALADIAKFIEAINSGHHFQNPRWILFGCSEAGALVAWFRLRHPDLALGAVSSSPSLLAKVDLWEYLAVVKNVLYAYDKTCGENIAMATETIIRRMEYNDRVSDLEKMFHACRPCDFYLQENVATFMYQLFNLLSLLVKESRNNAGPFSNVLTVKMICDQMMNAHCPAIRNYASVFAKIIPYLGMDCIVCKYDQMIAECRSFAYEDNTRRFAEYQRVSEFGYCLSSDLEVENPFSHKFPTSFVLRTYKDIFGIPAEKVHQSAQETNARYGGKHLNKSNVLIVNGMKDPWHPTSIVHNPPPGVVVVNIPGRFFTFAVDNLDDADHVWLLKWDLLSD